MFFLFHRLNHKNHVNSNIKWLDYTSQFFIFFPFIHHFSKHTYITSSHPHIQRTSIQEKHNFMETQLVSTGFRHSTLPVSYIRPEHDRPKLSEVANYENAPIIDLACGDRKFMTRQIAQACHKYGFFQVTTILLLITSNLIQKQ